MESNHDKANKLTFEARKLLVRYVFALVVIYIGFVIMTSLSDLNDEPSVRNIEIGLAMAIIVVLGIVIFKTVSALRLLKMKEDWR